MSSATEGLLGAIQAAQQQSESTTAAIAGCTSAAEAATAAFQQSGGNDKIALLGQIQAKLQEAQGIEAQVAAHLSEIFQLAGIVRSGQAGLLPTADGGTITHPAARPAGPPQLIPLPPVDPTETAKRSAVDKQKFLGAALRPEQVDVLLKLVGERLGNKVRGAWISPDKRTVKEIVSGRHGLAREQAVQNFRAVWKEVMPSMKDWNATVVDHAEVKAAMQIFTGHQGHHSMVINDSRGPCKGDLGCHAVLNRFIPEGSSLTVYWPGGYKIFGGR